MYAIVLNLAPLVCSAPDIGPGMEHGQLARPSFEEVRHQISRGMSERQVVSMLAAAYLDSGRPVHVERIKEHDYRVEVSKLHYMIYHFDNGKLSHVIWGYTWSAPP